VTVPGSLTPDERFAAAVAALGAGPGRTRRLLEGYEPAAAWAALAAGRHPGDPRQAYRTKAGPALVEAVEAACVAAGVAVRILGTPDYPPTLAADHEAPGVLFSLGDPSFIDTTPRVAIVGTRGATPYGLGVASELGRGLAEAGVAVVSGLARGIDAAGHAGALAVPDGGRPVAVIGPALDAGGSGADVLLQRAIADRGVVFSERAPGSTGAPPWCFVVRNRIMAALAHVVVVVECHHKGGAFHTVKAAAERGVALMAVPGSVRSSASAGCNALLVDGAAPVRDASDVLAAVELAITGRPGVVPPRPASRVAAERRAPVPAPTPAAALVLRALDHDPASLDTVVRRCAMPLAEVADALERLDAAGLAAGVGGWWSRCRG
jgi:DNA processing protein